VYKRGRGATRFELYLSALRKNPNRLLNPLAARLPSLLLFAGDLARVKQTARRRRWYVAMPTSSSSAAATPLADASFEETLSTVAAEELRAGDTVDFGASRMSLVRVQDMHQLGYFGGGVARVPGAEEVPEPKRRVGCFRGILRHWSSPAYASIRGRSLAQIQRPGPPADAERRGGLVKICLGNDFVRRAAIGRSLREALLSALAEKDDQK
jgi:hypothetical protein